MNTTLPDLLLKEIESSEAETARRLMIRGTLWLAVALMLDGALWVFVYYLIKYIITNFPK